MKRLILAASLLLSAAVWVRAQGGDSDLVDQIKAMRAQHEPVGPLLKTGEQLIPQSQLAGHRMATLLVLHTNDIHDILKPPANKLGGLAYIAGYVESMRAARPDSLFLDAGDICRKGDAMGPASKGEASYLALASIGLDATVPGNNDFVYGLDRLVENVRTSRIPILCAGMVYTDTGESVFPETMIKKVGSLRIGIIGATVPIPSRSSRPFKKFDMVPLGKRINELEVALRPQVDLTILVIHNGTAASRKLAAAAPGLNVIVCGHTNEITQKAMRAPTGALIVTVGRAGQWVGTLDLSVDCDQKKVASYTYQMVAMDHKVITPDPRVEKVVDDLEKKWPGNPSDAAGAGGL